MGGSLGLALAARAHATVRGYDPDPSAREAALERGCVAPAHDTLAAGRADGAVGGARAPVAPAAGAVAATVAAAPPEATVTDVGSTKANVVRRIAGSDRARFVGGHPGCGSEARGAAAARATLFGG